MNITLKDGYVENYAIIGDLVGGIKIDDSLVEDISCFILNPSAYYMIDGKLKLDSHKLDKMKEDDENKILRNRREQECFQYINRGMLWYNKLTDEQNKELSEWYQDWLDVTDTKVIPESPEWLKEL